MSYEHEHPVIDSDRHFIINPISRAVTNVESKKNTLIQHDHNSEEFTFEIPRYVDGHDMTECNSVQIHYINIEAGSSKKNTGIYEVVNFPSDVEEEVEGNIVFSWIISGNATEYAGTLSFLISFICSVDGVATYRWNTAINSSIIISKGIFNDESIVESYPDILAQWRKELFETNYAYEGAVRLGFEGTEAEWLDSLNGLTAYEVAVRNGYSGSEAEWLASLHGGHEDFSATLQASGWYDAGGGVFQFDCSIPGILPTDEPFIDIAYQSHDIEFMPELIAVEEEFAKIYFATTGQDVMSFRAKERPDKDIPIKIKVVR